MHRSRVVMCNTTGHERESFVGAKINAAASVIFIILALIASLSVLFGNSLLLAILLRRAALKKIKSLNLLIAELAVADFLAVGYWLPFFVFDLLLEYHPVLNQQHCLANGYLVITASVVSSSAVAVCVFCVLVRGVFVFACARR